LILNKMQWEWAKARCLPSERLVSRFLNAAETAIVTLSTAADFIASVAEFVRCKWRHTLTQKSPTITASSPPARGKKELHTRLREARGSAEASI